MQIDPELQPRCLLAFPVATRSSDSNVGNVQQWFPYLAIFSVSRRQVYYACEWACTAVPLHRNFYLKNLPFFLDRFKSFLTSLITDKYLSWYRLLGSRQRYTHAKGSLWKKLMSCLIYYVRLHDHKNERIHTYECEEEKETEMEDLMPYLCFRFHFYLRNCFRNRIK